MDNKFKLKYELLDKNSINDIYNLYKTQKIELPKFQRGLTWNNDQKQKLIDSIQSGKPIGGFLFAKSEDEDKYKVIDGLQRFSTIIDFKSDPTKYISKSDTLLSEELIKEFIHLELKAQDVFYENDNLSQKQINDKRKEILNNFSNIYQENKDSPDEIGIEFYEFYSNHLDNKITPELKNCLKDIRIELMTKIDLESACIPITVYTGDDQDELADIFVLLNNEGTALSKYEILAAKWNNKTINFNKDFENNIMHFINQKYDSISNEANNETNLNYNLSDKGINIYEYFLSLSIELSNSSLFYDGSSKFSKLEAGFIISSILLTRFPNQIDIISEIVNDKTDANSLFIPGLERLYSSIVDTVNELDNIIVPFLLNGNSTKKIQFLSDYAKYNLFISYYLNKFEIKLFDFNDNELDTEIITKNFAKNNKLFFSVEERNVNDRKSEKNFRENFILHLIMDEMKSHWNINRQVSDFKNEVSDVNKREKFWNKVTKYEFEKELQNWVNFQMSDDSNRFDTNNFKDEVKFVTLVTHNYVCSINQHYRSIYKGNKIEFDHIVAKSNIESKGKGSKFPKSSVLNILPLSKKANGIKTNNEISVKKDGMNYNIDDLITSTYKVNLAQACISGDISADEFKRKFDEYMMGREKDYISAMIEIYSEILN